MHDPDLSPGDVVSPVEAEAAGLAPRQFLLRRLFRSWTRRPKGGSAAVLYDAGALLTSRMLVAVMGWTGTLLIVRSLSQYSWGQFSFVFNFLALLVVITDAVSSRVALRGLIDRDDPERFAGSYVILRGILGVLAYLLALCFVVVGNYPDVVIRATALGGLVVVISAVSAGYEPIFQVEQRMSAVGTATVFGQVAQLGLTVALAVIGSTVVLFTIPAILCEIVILAWSLYRVRPLLRVRYVVLISTWGSLIRAAAPLAIGGALMVLYSNLDMIMLSKMDTFNAVGIYGIAYKFSGIVQMVPFALGAAITGMLVRAWPDEQEVFWSAFRRALLLLFSAAVLILVEFAVFAGPAISLLYGARYDAATVAARLVVSAECLGFFTALSITTMIAQDRNRLYPIAGLTGVALNLGINFWLIPLASYNGAAWATLVTELVVATVLFGAVVHGRLRALLPGIPMLKTLAAGAVALGVAVALDAVVPWPAALAASTMLFLVLLHLSKAPGPRGLRSFSSDAPSPAGGTMSPSEG